MSSERSPAPSPGRVAILLATFFGTLYLTVGTFLFGVVTLALSWIPPRGRLFFWFCQRWGWGWLRAAGIRVRREVETPLDPAGRYVFMANHASYLDIPAMMATLPSETRFMAKKGLFKLPVVGQAMWAGGFIGVDRSDRSRARDTFAAAVRELEGRASVLIFPEGTRSSSGELQEFQRGGFLIALRSGRPIVPVGIEGSFEAQPRGTWVVRPGEIVVRYGRPIEVESRGVRGRAELSSLVRERIAGLLAAAGPVAESATSDKVGGHG